jgi:uncharacterized protein (TIGR04255 family)
MLLPWNSVHHEHAIERVRFEVQFSEPMPKKVVEMIGLRHDSKISETRFGARQEQQITKMMIGPTGPMLSQQGTGNEVGWLSTRVQGVSNVPVEAVALQNSLISYESSDYRGWTKSFTRFQSVCGDLLSEAGNLVNASSATLEYTDRFIFEGDLTKAKPSELVRDIVLNLLPESALSGQEIWHIHRGWYEMLGNNKCLINQNFDAQQGIADFKKEVRSLQIFSKCEVRDSEVGFSIADVFDKFHLLHTRSIELLSDAITAEMADKIGMRRGD